MNRLIRLSGVIISAMLVLAAVNTPSRVVLEMLHNTGNFLAALDTRQMERASFSFGDSERTNWHFIPRERKGLPFGNMTAAQRKLAHALLSTALSSQGLQQANQIMYLEKILFELENQSPRRDSDGYFFSVFGTPSAAAAWGWRMEGHHLSLNLTISKGEVISTSPAFFGSNPAIVEDGAHAGLQVLKAEEELGRQLVKLFDKTQRNRALINAEAPTDIVTGASLRVDVGAPAGIAVKAMSAEQKELLIELLRIYASRFRPELAQKNLGQTRAGGLDQLHFAWAGSLKPGEPHYYRIQSESFVVEYDNTQNNANHVHSVWRDIRNDFGRDLLQEHYHEAH